MLISAVGLGIGPPRANGEALTAPTIAPEDLGYAVRLRRVEDGIPSNFMRCLVQDPNGYLWWPNDWGLARFDGVRLKTFLLDGVPGAPALLSRVLSDSRGQLWVAGGAAIGRLHDGRFEWVQSLTGFAGNAHVCADSTGGGWLALRSEHKTWVLRLDANSPTLLNEDPLPLMASSIGVDEHERIWLTQDGLGVVEVLDLPAPGKPWLRPVTLEDAVTGHLFHLESGPLAVAGASGIHEHRDGQWIRTRRFPTPIQEKQYLVQTTQDAAGNYWIGTRTSGLWVSTADGRVGRLDLPGLLLDEGFGIGAVLCDRENTIWVGTRHGLYELQRVAFRKELKSSALRETEVVDVGFDRQQRIWALTEAGKVVCFPSGRGVATIPEWSGHARFLEVGEDDSVWLADDAGAWRLQDGSVQEWVPFTAPGQGSLRLQSLALSGSTAWIGTIGAGLWRIRQGEFAREALPSESWASQRVHVAANARGQVRVFVEGVGLFARAADGWRTVPTPARVLAQAPSGLHVDPEGRTWRYGSRPPLLRQRDDQWTALPLRLTEVPVEVIAAASDDEGGLWALTKAHGVVRIAREFDAPDAPDPKWFGVDNGLPSIAGRGWGKGVSKSPDGRMWFATAAGVGVVAPREWLAVKAGSLPPQVHIEEVRYDNVGFDWQAQQPVTLPARGNRLEIQYTAIGLKNAHQNRFRYRLEGFDDAWTDAGSSRSAIFRRLPPGEYTFRVVASNSQGVWNLEGASLAFTVLPTWWQTYWFRSGVAALVLLGLWGLRALKLRQVAREFARREEFTRRLIQSQEAERKRIAGDLHDSLGQNLLIAKNQLFLVQESTHDATISPRLTKVAESVSAALDEARTISHALRPFQLERLGLTKALRALVRQVSDSARIPLHARIENVDGLLPPESEVIVYRLLQEALNNVLKHADAAEVGVVVEPCPGGFRLEVRDDGRGFEVTQLRSTQPGASGLGFAGFEERTRLLGGRFQCQSAPGRGTALTFEIPSSRPSSQAGAA